MENYVEQYFSFAVELLQTVIRESGAAIYQAAEVVAEAIENDRDVLLFGSGHSALIARDATGRAGGLVPVMAIQDIAEGDAERIEGVAQAIVARYELRPGSVIIIISNSGINAVPIDMALLSKEAGLKVIAITSLAHSKSVASRHSSGKKLYDEADIVIDVHSVRGDAAIELPGSKLKSGATSTLVGAAILQSMTVQAAALLAERGMKPPVFVSANVPEGDAHNLEMVTRYRSRLVRYGIPVTGMTKKHTK
jgi:uncharacterized phosphosugar-binding protein